MIFECRLLYASVCYGLLKIYALRFLILPQNIVYWYLLPIEPVNYIFQTGLPVAIHGTSL